MTVEAYEALRRSDVLRADAARAEPSYRLAYQWMRGEYERRIPGASGAPLVWAWARFRRRELIEQLGTEGTHVLTTLRVPRERVLLSDFEDWHAVLNQWELHPRDMDEAEVDRRIDAFWDDMAALGTGRVPMGSWPAPLRRRVLASWDQVFQIGSPPRVVQAVIERIDAAEVVDAVVLSEPTPEAS